MLKTLEIFALRGATTPLTITFEKNKKITIIYGENGTGKSTICDALEFLGKGAVGSLDGKGLGRNERYWHSTGKKPTDLSVRLTTAKSDWEGRLNKSKPVITGGERPRVEILRRRQILTLITEVPSKRYDAVKPFIDIEGVETSEKALLGLIKEEKRALEVAVARLSENQTALEQYWEQAGAPEGSALSWARSEAAKDTTEITRESHRFEEIIKSCFRVLEEDDRLKDAEENEIRAAEELESARKIVRQEQTRIASKTEGLVEVLTAAKHYFEKHPDPLSCPLCGSGEFAGEMSTRVESQLQSLRSLESALRTEQNALHSETAAQKRRENEGKKLLSAASSMLSLLKSDSLLLRLSNLEAAAQSVENFESNSPDPALRSILVHQTERLLEQARAEAVRLEQELGFFTALKNALENYDVNHQIQAARDALLPKLEAALSLVERNRREFVDNILTEISSKVGELYEKIHPGEGLEKIKLMLDAEKRASLEIQTDFPGAESAPPGAYFSESHLDTLGLCIWLAMAERDHSSEKILVLDDIIGSVDEQHAERTVEMLYEESARFQHCILTTHYRPWREKYRWGWLQNGQCHFVELRNWEHSSGIRQGDWLPPVRELKQLLDSSHPSPQQVSASAGVILEAILDFLTLQYECSIPRRKGKFTLGDMLPNVNKKLRAALRIERAIQIENSSAAVYETHEIGKLLDELQEMIQLRNIFGCHFNDLAHFFSPNDAIQFAQKVHRLADLLIDPEAGWPMSDKSGEYWSNSNKSVRLLPLRQPK